MVEVLTDQDRHWWKRDKCYNWERWQSLAGNFTSWRVRKVKLKEFAIPNKAGQDWCPGMEKRKVRARDNTVC